MNTRHATPEAFGYYTGVRSIDPTYSKPPAYSGGNAREELDDVPQGGEVALSDFDVRVRIESNGRNTTDRTYEVSYRVDYDGREVVAKTVSQRNGATSSKRDATLAALPVAATLARADRAARSFLDREGLDFKLRSFGELVDDARGETNDVLVTDAETVVDAQTRAEQKNREAIDD